MSRLTEETQAIVINEVSYAAEVIKKSESEEDNPQEPST